MNEAAFSFPSLVWIFPLPVMLFLALWMLTRKAVIGIFVAFAVVLVSWGIYQARLTSYLESWLSSQRVYAILFQDFPKDKAHFVSEYASAFRSGGEPAVARKHEEMKIIMMVNHVKHYIAKSPASVIKNYIAAETWLLSALYAKDRTLCQSYLGYSGVFERVWTTVGNDVFLASIRYNPEMIVDAVDHSEVVSDNDRFRASLLYKEMVNSMRSSGIDLRTDALKIMSCDAVYREFYLLSQMPPQDSALIIKFLYSEDHLKHPEAERSLLQMLLPF